MIEEALDTNELDTGDLALVEEQLAATNEAASGPAVLGATTDRLRDDNGRFGPVEDLDQHRSEIIAAAVAAAVAGGAAGAVGEATSTDAESTEAGPAQPLVIAGADGTDDEATSLATAGLLTGADDGSGTDETASDEAAPVAVGAASAAGLGLFEPAGADAPPMVATAATPVITTAGRRPGGALLALVGAGTAAAVLLAGTLWWANSSTSTSTSSDDQADTEQAASPSTSEPEILAGSLSGPAERSTGDDDQPSEFQGGEESTASTLTITPTTTDGQTDTSGGLRTTTVPGGATSEVTVGVSTSRPSSTTEATTSSSTTSAPQQTTAAPTSTTAPPTTTTTVAPDRPVYIGDQVTVGGYNGQPLANVQVSLYSDTNRDGRGDRLIANQTTDAAGRYSFDQAPGCYEVRFTAPGGYEIRSDLSRQALCLDSGGSNARVDAIADALVAAAPPSSCTVEEAGDDAGLGVEVDEFNNNWADSYTFYSRTGGVVARTRNLGPYDTDPGQSDREWFGAENGFNHRNVWSVAAERNGIESDRITCRRL